MRRFWQLLLMGTPTVLSACGGAQPPEWDTLTIDVRRNVLASLAREITVGRDKQVRIVWKEAGELAVDYTIGALPELRVSVIKALPAPRMTVSDLLGTAQRELAGTVK
jgi:hypothetical protein